ncbi:ATP-binding protein [Actinophytocola sp.]|uniref:ATP-binding protein n=1 Tax=Actinophytocola sp. TaxID=1872138 RepID=UPI002D7F9947|nr:ATP-binding protein [Actinophytocola sp.]HET9140374.1 ATP-binding protein [Actinophytocola sp.]
MRRSDPNFLAITVPAHGDQLPWMRDRMQRWLSDQDIPPTMCADIVLAAHEALTNSVEHAYRRRDAPGTMDLAIMADPDTVSFSVTDHGEWRNSIPEQDSPRGHGLPMIRALAAQVDLVPTSHGTALTARFPRHD